MPKYLVILEDGAYAHAIFQGSASALSVSLENAGYVPTVIFPWADPLYFKDGMRIDLCFEKENK